MNVRVKKDWKKIIFEQLKTTLALMMIGKIVGDLVRLFWK